jgi:hypothetical protein
MLLALENNYNTKLIDRSMQIVSACDAKTSEYQ